MASGHISGSLRAVQSNTKPLMVASLGVPGMGAGVWAV
jgi:hypothetical protein